MIRILLDVGLPRRAAADLREHSFDAQHVGELGLVTMPDEEILRLAAREGYTITLSPARFSAVAYFTL